MNYKKNVGDIIELSSDINSESFDKYFTIIDQGNNSEKEGWFKQGGSAICYDAFYCDERGYNHYGKLKMFYLADESKDFQIEARSYISSYETLHKIVSDNKEMSKIYSFIPEFEIYYDNEKCPYIWTNNVPMCTFEDMCEQILVSENREENGGYRVEDTLFEIVATLRALSDCVRILHENSLIHGDINPGNFGYYIREKKILVDSVCLFDLDSLHYAYQKKKTYNPPYYDYDESELVRQNFTDVKAIVISLCRAIGLSNNQIERIKSIRNRTRSKLLKKSAVESIVFDAKIFERKGLPANKTVCDQIVKIITEIVAYNPRSTSINSASKLCYELKYLETLLFPWCHNETLKNGQGISIVNKASERKDRIHEVFRYHFYEKPLYLSESASDIFGVLLIGFGLDAQSFLDVCLETVQSMGKKIEVEVWGNEEIFKDEIALYFKERPSLSQFFLIDNNKEKLTGEAYGSIMFHVRPNGELVQQVDRILKTSNAANYIYISVGDDTENTALAKAFFNKKNSRVFSINVQCESPIDDTEGLHYINVEENVRERPNYSEIERMSFNTHMVWSGTLNENLDKKKESFLSDYYHESCVSNVLSMKYKLHWAGIDISEGAGNIYKAAEEFKNISNKKKKKMIAMEHKRWVVEKLCDGWSRMSVEESLLYNDTKDVLGKRHVCLLRSSEAEGLIGEWEKHSKWDYANNEELMKLDELDRMSVELHQAYKRYADSFSDDDLVSKNVVRDIVKELDGERVVLSSFFEWRESIDNLRNEYYTRENEEFKGEYAISEYEKKYSRLLSEINKINDGLKRQSLQNHVNRINSTFLSIVRALKYHDYKKNDKELIYNIPFILTYTEDIIMIVPIDNKMLVATWENADPTTIFSYVASATVINPQKLYLPYCALDNVSNERKELISQKEKAIREYVHRKGLRSDVIFVPVTKETDWSEIICNKDNIKYNGWVLCEDNGNNILNEKSVKKSAVFVGKYKFDMNKILFLPFNETSNLDWLNEINRKVAVNTRDVAGFLGRTVEISDQPSFSKQDSKILFGIYTRNRDIWRYICSVLKTKENKKQSIEVFDDSLSNTNKEIVVKKYILRNKRYDSLENMLKTLKGEKIIKKDSCLRKNQSSDDSVLIRTYKTFEKEIDIVFNNDGLFEKKSDFRFMDRKKKRCLTVNNEEMEEVSFDIHRQIFFMPYSCFKKVKEVIKVLIKGGVIYDESNVEIYSVDSCKVFIYGNNSNSTIISNLFSRQDLFESENLYSLVSNIGAKKLKLVCDGLKVESVKLSKDKEKKAKELLCALQRAGFMQIKTKKEYSFDIIYGSHQIKRLFMQEGNLLEVYTHYKFKELNKFDDVVTGVKFRKIGTQQDEKEIDCIVTKGFQTLIIECKAKAMKKDTQHARDVLDMINELEDKVSRYGINGNGLLIIDSDKIPEVGETEKIRISSDIKDIGNVVSKKYPNL